MSTKDDIAKIKFKHLRICIGLLGMLLPVAIVGITFFFGCDHLQDSISHYYYTGAGTVFTGILFGLGLTLIFYPTPKKGETPSPSACKICNISVLKESYDGPLTTFSGICAWIVAFFPTNSICGEACALFRYESFSWRVATHYAAAATMLLIFSYMSICVFTRSSPSDLRVNRWKRLRNFIYISCGILTFLSILAVGLLAIREWLWEIPVPETSTFWLEVSALLPFGFSWLVKGGFIFTDTNDDSAVKQGLIYMKGKIIGVVLVLLIIVAFAVLLLFFWSPPMGFSPVIKRDLMAYNDTTITLSEKPRDNIDILYTGCGGLVIGHGGEGLMTDPYYTGHRVNPRNLIGIKARRDNQEKVLKAIREKVTDPKKIGTVLISHSHYDHMQDLPGLLAKKDLAGSVRVVGSKSTFVTVRNFMDGQVFVDADELSKSDKWTHAAPGMSVYVIRSEHAPHFYFGIGAMDGETNEEDFKNFNDPFERTDPFKWKEGGTFSYLLDVFNKDASDTFRVFIQQSASNAAIGFPPKDQLNNKNVDLAILCYASYSYVEFYPDSLLNYLKPRKTLFIHWEDFFDDLYKCDPYVVPMSGQYGFFRRIERVRHIRDQDLSKFILFPKPLTRVRVAY